MSAKPVGVSPDAGDGSCFNCTKSCTDRDYCHGCRQHVCDNCSKNFTLPRSHQPREHLTEAY